MWGCMGAQHVMDEGLCVQGCMGCVQGGRQGVDKGWGVEWACTAMHGHGQAWKRLCSPGKMAWVTDSMDADMGGMQACE